MLLRYRLSLSFFIFGLIASGLTTFPLRWELTVLDQFCGGRTAVDGQQLSGLSEWIAFVHNAINDINARFPFFFYATDWLGFRDVVVETETGRLVAPHAPPELADALEALLRDRELRAAYGSAGRRRYEALYTLDRFVTDVALCLREVGRA